MLWPEHDIDWPDGEVNIVEGKMGGDTMLTNLHWKDPIGDGFEWERTILFRPVMFPGIHPQFK